MTENLFEFLTPEHHQVSRDEQVQLSQLEKIFYYLNMESCFYFRYPTEVDLRTILRDIKDKESIKKLATCTKTIIGNVNKEIVVENKVKSIFNNHVFYPKQIMGKQYLLDLMDFPVNLKEKEITLAISEFERFIRTNALIKEKRDLLAELGYTYFVHYDPNKLISYVISDDS